MPPRAKVVRALQAAEKVHFRKTAKNKSRKDAQGAICWPSVMVLYPQFRRQFGPIPTFFRNLFSPCHRKNLHENSNRKAQGLKPHSFLRLYGTTKVVP
jgi:hypothetical protein